MHDITVTDRSLQVNDQLFLPPVEVSSLCVEQELSLSMEELGSGTRDI